MNANRDLSHEVSIAIDARTQLCAELCVPAAPLGLVIIAHVSASGRKIARHRAFARALERERLATLALDLLSVPEEESDRFRRRLHFDASLLGGRLILAALWLRRQPDVYDLPIGIFGAGTGGTAALVAAAHESDRVRTVVTRGGRLDLVPDDDVAELRTPTLVIVGGADVPILAATRRALPRFLCPISLEIVPGAAHLFEKPGALDRVTALAGAWFVRELGGEEAITQPMRKSARS